MQGLPIPARRAGYLVPIYQNRIMFAHDLCHSQIESLRNSTRREPQGRTIDFNRKDRATRGAGACAARATSTNIQFSIVNSQFRLVRVG